MSNAVRVKSKRRASHVMALTVIGSSLVAQGQNGSPGPLAQSCGVPSGPSSTVASGRGGPPTFPAGQYPVKLPPVSLLGAPNDLPNPYRPGVSWVSCLKDENGGRRRA
jgi:hypothetical protein